MIGLVELSLGAAGQSVLVAGDVLGGGSGARHCVRVGGGEGLDRMVKGMGVKLLLDEAFSVGPPGGARNGGHWRRLNSHSSFSGRFFARAIDGDD